MVLADEKRLIGPSLTADEDEFCTASTGGFEHPGKSVSQGSWVPRKLGNSQATTASPFSEVTSQHMFVKGNGSWEKNKEPQPLNTKEFHLNLTRLNSIWNPVSILPCL